MAVLVKKSVQERFNPHKTSVLCDAAMRKASAAFITALLATAAAGTLLVRLGTANPFLDYKDVSPPYGSIPLQISVLSPSNNTAYNTNDVTLAFNITAQNTSIHYLLGAYYQASWMPNNVTVYKQDIYGPEFPTSWYYSKTFQQMPDGDYSINITTWGGGGYASEGLTYNFFHMTTNSIINFTVDTIPPTVRQTSIGNWTYYESDLPLDLVTNETVTQVTYTLDGQESVTVAGNATLSGLNVGLHKVTVYARDAAGNIGASETVSFTVSEPEPPAEPVGVVAVITVAAAGLLLFRRKRHKEAQQT